MLLRCCLALLLLALTSTCSRLKGRVGSKSPEAKVAKLIADISESLRKEGEDEELVFASVTNFEEQFGASLDREVSMLNETLVKLNAMDSEYRLEVNSSSDELQYLGTSVNGSEQAVGAYVNGVAKTSKKYDSLLNSVHMLTALLQAAKVTGSGQLATPEVPDATGRPRRVYTAMWKLLSSQPQLRTSFADVFTAFAPLPNGQGVPTQPPKMTPALVQRATAALRQIRAKVEEHKSTALMQLEAKEQQFAAAADSDQLNAETQRGVQAEDEQKSAELSYSINFTLAVLNVDRTFHKTLQNHMNRRLNVTRSTRGVRESLLSMMATIESHLGGKNVPLSFLEVKATSEKQPKQLSTLQTVVENTIRKHGDTHSILMKIKSLLFKAEPVDAASVQGVVSKMGSVLRSVESEQTRAEEATRRCDAQKFRAGQEDRGLRANLALMSAAQNHTRAAIQAAKNNLNGITSKVGALERSSHDFSSLVKQALSTLGGQSRDRGTISLAVKKAQEVIAAAAAGSQQVIGELVKVSNGLAAQEVEEAAFRDEEAIFQASLKKYADDYVLLLKARRLHYEQSLAALDLYTSELSSDVIAQTDAVKSNTELLEENRRLCDSVTNFYTKHNARRADLSSALRAVLPKVPEILSMSPST